MTFFRLWGYSGFHMPGKRYGMYDSLRAFGTVSSWNSIGSDGYVCLSNDINR